MKRSIKRTSKYFALAAILFTIGGCSKEAPKKDYVAKVNGSYLTANEMNSLIDSSRQSSYKNEIIRNWINKELLYQKALKDGITSDEEFTRVLKNTRKELAVTLFLEKLYSRETVTPTETEIENYYNKNKSDYRLFYDAFVINKIDFRDENKAIKFRAALLGSSWDRTLNVYQKDPSIIETETGHLYYEYELQPAALTRIVKELNRDEISIVFSEEKDVYTVVQLVQRFSRGTIPPFNYIKGLVQKRLEAEKKEEFLKNYIKELYSKNDIEVKNQE